ncbi:MAG: gliding motility-associated C-terminal domain-containing protein [Bacteroidia bacterium]
MRALWFLGIVFLLTLNSVAQKRAHHWHFYNEAAVDFSSGSAVADTSGKMKLQIGVTPPIYWDEGATSMSDTSGNLLFYSDGVTVWDQTHQIMQNGANLSGHWSASRGVIAIPHPANTNQYYLFTQNQTYPTNLHMVGTKGLHYSLIDMSLNNGNGAVISNKKNKLVTDLPLFAEKLAAIQRMDGGYWLIAYAINAKSFFAYDINELGLNPQPIISKSSDYYGGYFGMLAFSPTGETLVQITSEANRLEFYDFDIETGRLSLNISISDLKFYHMPGIAFSPSGEFLYIGGGKDRTPYPDHTPRIYQLDLGVMDSASIHNSMKIIYDYQDTSFVETIGNIQLGPDGKIYVATVGSSSLGIVNQPDSVGMACDYDPFGISLAGRRNSAALPNFVTNWIIDCSRLEPISIGRDTTLCSGDVLKLSPDKPFTSVVWQDGSSNKQYTVTQPGLFIARIQRLQCISYDTIEIDYYPDIQNKLGQDTTLCPGESLLLSAQEDNASYSWQDGSTNADYLANTPATYSLRTTVGLCSQSDTLILDYHTPPVFSIGSDTSIYSTDELYIDASSDDPEAIYLWSDGFHGPARSISNPGLYIVNVRSNTCEFPDSIRIEVADLIIPNIITPNEDGINESFIIRGSGYEQWNLQIFDRFGRPVYKSENYQSDWRGNNLETGTYYYALIDRKTERIFKGWVLVVR